MPPGTIARARLVLGLAVWDGWRAAGAEPVERRRDGDAVLARLICPRSRSTARSGPGWCAPRWSDISRRATTRPTAAGLPMGDVPRAPASAPTSSAPTAHLVWICSASSTKTCDVISPRIRSNGACAGQTATSTIGAYPTCRRFSSAGARRFRSRARRRITDRAISSHARCPRICRTLRSSSRRRTAAPLPGSFTTSVRGRAMRTDCSNSRTQGTIAHPVGR